MSAIRVNRRDEDGYTRAHLIDPYTGKEYAGEPLPVRGSGPVEVVRPATSAPAARPSAQLLTDEEIRERHVKGALAAQAARKRNQVGA